MTKLSKTTKATIITNIDEATSSDLGYAKLVEERKIETNKWVFIEGCQNPKSMPESKKFYKEFDSTPNEAGKALLHLQSNLTDIEEEISNLESRVNDLRALKQLIIRELHEIGRETLEGYLERQVLYNIVEDRAVGKEGKSRGKKSIYQLSKVLDENESRIKDAVVKINSKLEKSSAEILLDGLR